jgi:hypothetical protein
VKNTASRQINGKNGKCKYYGLFVTFQERASPHERFAFQYCMPTSLCVTRRTGADWVIPKDRAPRLKDGNSRYAKSKAKPGEVQRVPAIRELTGCSLWSWTTMNPVCGRHDETDARFRRHSRVLTTEMQKGTTVICTQMDMSMPANGRGKSACCVLGRRSLTVTVR